MKKRAKAFLAGITAAVLFLLSACAGSGSREETSLTPADSTSETGITEEKEEIPMNNLTYEQYMEKVGIDYAVANSAKLQKMTKQDVIAAVAKAYYNRSYASHTSTSKPLTQYDQYNNRRNFNATPEDATADRVLYLDCSSFVNSVYYYTFGRNLLEAGNSITTKKINTYMAAKTAGEDNELLYYITGDTLAKLKSDKSEAQKLIDEIKSQLEPGDLINYYRADSGHIIMYLGDGKIIHSIGSANAKTTNGTTDPKTSLEKYTDDEKRFGTVNITDWDEFFTTTVTPASQNDGRTNTSNRYLFASNVTAIAIFRPLSENDGSMKQLSMQGGAVDHYLYEGLNIEKTAKTGQNGKETPVYYGASVYSGEEITFTVTLTNTSDAEMRSLCISENIANCFDYVCADDGVYFDEKGIICFYFTSLEAGKTTEVSYTLRVKSGLAAGDAVEDSGTYVNQILTNRLIFQYAGTNLDSDKLGAAIESKLGQKYENSVKAAIAVYESIEDGNQYESLNSFTSPQNIIATLIPESLLLRTEKGSDIASRVLYGGTTVGSAEISNANKLLVYDNLNARVRRVLIKNIENGDIICTYTKNGGDKYTAYLYYNLGLYGTDDSGTFVKLDTEKVSSGTSIQDYLDTLTAYNKFVIIRPKLAP